MSPAESYRKRAAELRAQARDALSPKLNAEWTYLANCYLLLAEQADKNALTDTLYEPPPLRLAKTIGPKADRRPDDDRRA